ncbi:MAG TPA: hypothetical protein VFO63_15210 [Blastocatellia bacterium]|nr:hypothetical protein [Blastocatellia bacterium]
MVVTEAVQAIDNLKRKVMWRARMIALQDHAAIILIVGGSLAAAVALYIKLKPIQTAWWPYAVAAFVVVAVALLTRWLRTGATERFAVFKIDQSLGLEDRITTAQTIIERGGPASPIETALIEDAAARIAEAKASQIVPYAAARWHALSLLGVAALVTAMAVPQKALPGVEELIAERANIESAGDRLEQTSAEVEQSAPAGTDTQKLAREQADLGRALRRMNITKAEALKKLSALESRIRERHDELASTRADEIVSLAEKRFQPALAPKPKESQKQSATAEQSELNQSQPGDKSKGNQSKPTLKDDVKASEPRVGNKNPDASKQASSESKKAEANAATGNQPVAADRKPPAEEAARNTGEQNRPKPQTNTPTDKQQAQPASSETQSAGQQKAAEQQKAEAEKNPSGSLAEQAAKAMPESTVEQAAKAATPMLSDQLLKQAEQLRANQLTPEDIRSLRQAAESLAKDLAPLAQSKEFQQMVEQLARQVDADQLERVARELMSREEIRREIESAARLLMENREVKEMVAGFRELARSESRNNQQNGQPNNPGANQNQPQTPGSDGESKSRMNGQPNGRGEGQGEGPGRGRGPQERRGDEVKLSAGGREVRPGGTIQRKPGGEYLFLQAKPGVGAARAPYSSAYPQYRREAERSVERSQVPQHMRSVIRKYFDAINPDANKKQ